METKYITICKELGVRPDINFVRVLPGGAIDWTAGKPEEVRLLAIRAKAKGYKLSRNLRQHLPQ